MANNNCNNNNFLRDSKSTNSGSLGKLSSSLQCLTKTEKYNKFDKKLDLRNSKEGCLGAYSYSMMQTQPPQHFYGPNPCWKTLWQDQHQHTEKRHEVVGSSPLGRVKFSVSSSSLIPSQLEMLILLRNLILASKEKATWVTAAPTTLERLAKLLAPGSRC